MITQIYFIHQICLQCLSFSKFTNSPPKSKHHTGYSKEDSGAEAPIEKFQKCSKQKGEILN